MRKLFLDIETLPCDESSHDCLRLLFEKKHGNTNDAQEKFEDYLAKTTFDGAYGRLLCIGFAVDDDPVEVFCNDGNEKETLKQFWNLVQDLNHGESANRNYGYRNNYDSGNVLFIGHNVMDFDLRFIYQRSIVLGVKPSMEINFARYRNNPIFDTMKEWVKWNNSAVGLEYLALALGIPSPKDGIDGSQVFEFYKKGKLKDILEYCKRDVDTTRSVYRKMIFESVAGLGI